MWQRLGTQARIGLVSGCVAILGLVGALAVWAYRPNYQVLFAELAPRDAAAMAAELDKLKTPYQLADDGNTLLVPKDLVYKTRLKLMGQDLPLQGAVGFEVFNNADFGMTDFVQKVNYQRAVQGELTRTILSIENIHSARVHLAMPEQGLFKKAVTKAKASVTVAMKRGHVLEPQQVAGIQRLVAASVPDIASADVTVLDQHGVALTRPSASDQAGEGALAQLDSKRSTEDYLNKKVAQVLDRTFGPGEAIASVDVVLSLDQTKVTTDQVIPSRQGSADESPTGVVVRERHTVQDGATANGTGSPKAANGETTTNEAEYQVGRRVEQITVAPGAVKRLSIAVVVKKPLSEAQRDRLREVIALAAGFNAARGDAIVVSSIDGLVSAQAERVLPDTDVVPGELPSQATPAPAADNRAEVFWWLGGVAGLGLIAGLLRVRRRVPATQPAPPMRLGETQRAQLIADVRHWLQVPAESATEPK